MTTLLHGQEFEKQDMRDQRWMANGVNHVEFLYLRLLYNQSQQGPRQVSELPQGQEAARWDTTPGVYEL